VHLPPGRSLLFTLLASLLASCGGGGASKHFSLPGLISPAEAQQLLGAEVGPVGQDGVGDLEDRGNQSWQTNVRFETVASPKRMLRVQAWSWQVDTQSAQNQYFSQLDKFNSGIANGAAREKVTDLGEEAVSYRGNEKKDTALIVRRGNLVLAFHIQGGVAPDDQLVKLVELARKVLGSIPL
jgi:hypothetical protein